MGILKKIFGIDEMSSTELNEFMHNADDITRLIRIEHENEVLLINIRKRILGIYEELKHNPQLRTKRFEDIIHRLEVQLGIDKRRLNQYTKAQMLDEEMALKILGEVEGFIGAEKTRAETLKSQRGNFKKAA